MFKKTFKPLDPKAGDGQRSKVGLTVLRLPAHFERPSLGKAGGRRHVGRVSATLSAAAPHV